MPEKIQEIRNEDWSARQAAIENLLVQPDEEFLPGLETAIMDHEDAILRNAAMEAYRSAGLRALPSLLRLLGSSDNEVRIFAANILGDIGRKESVGDLIQALSDPDANVRTASAEALGKIGDERAVSPLEKMILDESGPESQWPALAAIDALAQIGGPEALRIFNRCLESKLHINMVFDGLERIAGRDAIKLIAQFIGNEELEELALKAIVNIARRNGERLRPEYFIGLVPKLIALYGSPKPEIRKSALIGLSWAEDARGTFCLIEALAEDDLQEYAISGLIKLSKKSVQAIIDSMKDVNRPERLTLARILLIMGEHEALMQFAADPDSAIRVEVALAAEKVSSKRVHRILSDLIKDPDKEVRAAARKALESKKISQT